MWGLQIIFGCAVVEAVYIDDANARMGGVVSVDEIRSDEATATCDENAPRAIYHASSGIYSA